MKNMDVLVNEPVVQNEQLALTVRKETQLTVVAKTVVREGFRLSGKVVTAAFMLTFLNLFI